MCSLSAAYILYLHTCKFFIQYNAITQIVHIVRAVNNSFVVILYKFFLCFTYGFPLHLCLTPPPPPYESLYVYYLPMITNLHMYEWKTRKKSNVNKPSHRIAQDNRCLDGDENLKVSIVIDVPLFIIFFYLKASIKNLHIFLFL